MVDSTEELLERVNFELFCNGISSRFELLQVEGLVLNQGVRFTPLTTCVGPYLWVVLDKNPFAVIFDLGDPMMLESINCSAGCGRAIF